MFTKLFFKKRLILFFLLLSSCFYFGTIDLFAQQPNNKKVQKSVAEIIAAQFVYNGVQKSEAKDLAVQLVSKYGEENCRALFVNKQLRVGMPFELFSFGYEEGLFSRFNYTSMSSDYGDGHFCLNLYKVGYDMRQNQIGVVWFTKYKVSSITYF